MAYEGIVAIVSIFIVAPTIVFGFVLLGKRGKNRVELARISLREAELGVERERLHVEALREENRKLDTMIEHRIESV
ncbi:MAG: hypothetical protein CVV47_07725 [Spirochaetae bacterium HGW-Spirochaetae-3]|jgi:hypothetical protein|nr:MAG: hypothetical protein CVV47_07725 [Spirochaetae bacterium HGW-Spirochaetae-3]